MNKEIYVVAGRDDEPYPGFRDRITVIATEINRAENPLKAWVTLTETPPPKISVIPFKRGKIAVFSVIRREGPTAPVTLLTEMEGFRFAVKADEATPVAYSKSWPDGHVTPGVCLLTLFRSRNDISHDTFLHRWHNSHTPLSLRIHPLWHYSRNVVLETIAGRENGWGGILEEHVTERSRLLNPFKFFGHPGVVVQNMIEVYRDTKSFLDYRTIETYLVREYCIRS